MVTIGTEVGEYDAEKMSAYDAKVAEAVALLANDEITQEQVTQMISALNNALLSAMIMPEGVNLLLTTNANKLENKSGWVSGLVGTSNNKWSLPLASADRRHVKFRQRKSGNHSDIARDELCHGNRR